MMYCIFLFMSVIVIALPKIMIVSWLFIKVETVAKFTWSSISIFWEDGPRDVSFIWNAWHQAPLLLKMFSFQFTEYFSCLNYIKGASETTQKLMILLLWRYPEACISRIDLHFSYKWGILSLLMHSYIKIEELVALCHYYLFLQVALYIWFL